MTKSDIENVIEYLRSNLPKHVPGFGGISCEVGELYNVLRAYPVDDDKTCGPDYEAMYRKCQAELGHAEEKIQSIKFDMHNLSIEHAQYVGAVAAMETIFGRKFEPNK